MVKTVFQYVLYALQNFLSIFAKQSKDMASQTPSYAIDTNSGARCLVRDPEIAIAEIDTQDPKEKYAMMPGLAEKLMQQLGNSIREIKQCKATTNLLMQKFPANPPRTIFTELERIEQQLRNQRTLLNEWNFQVKMAYATQGITFHKTPNTLVEELRKRVAAMGPSKSSLDPEFDLVVPGEN